MCVGGAAYCASLIRAWPILRRTSTVFADIDITDEAAASETPMLAALYDEYNRIRDAHSSVAARHADLDGAFYYTIRRGKRLKFHPRSLPRADKLSAIPAMFDANSDSSKPAQRALTAIVRHAAWLEVYDALREADANAPPGPIPHREATRFISHSSPGSEGAVNTTPDGTAVTTAASPVLLTFLQRKLGLCLSGAADAVDRMWFHSVSRGGAARIAGRSLARREGGS